MLPFFQVIAKDIPELVALLSDLNEKVWYDWYQIQMYTQAISRRIQLQFNNV